MNKKLITILILLLLLITTTISIWQYFIIKEMKLKEEYEERLSTIEMQINEGNIEQMQKYLSPKQISMPGYIVTGKTTTIMITNIFNKTIKFTIDIQSKDPTIQQAIKLFYDAGPHELSLNKTIILPVLANLNQGFYNIIPSKNEYTIIIKTEEGEYARETFFIIPFPSFEGWKKIRKQEK